MAPQLNMDFNRCPSHHRGGSERRFVLVWTELRSRSQEVVMSPAPDPMVAAHLDMRWVTFPVVAMHVGSGNELARPMAFGTCSCIGPGVFVTAGQVLQEVLKVGEPAIAHMTPGHDMAAARAQRHEIVESYDVGIMAAELPSVALLNWAVRTLPTP